MFYIFEEISIDTTYEPKNLFGNTMPITGCFVR